MSVFCVNCGTENKEEYKFCKNCGAELPDLSESYTPPVSISAEKVEADEGEIYGISVKHLKTFIGKNHEKILSRFDGMELADSRVSWCWPAAILGFFFGFFGISFWLFYRKMYKPALLSALIGTVFYIAQAFFAYEALKGVIPQLAQFFSPALFESGNYQLFLQSLSNTLTSGVVGVNFANIFADIEKTLAVILGGLFGLNLYKNHVVKKVTDIFTQHAEDETSCIYLKKSGGTHGGMAILGVVIMLVIILAVFTVTVAGLLMAL